MFCTHCQRYYLNLLDHLLEHVELRMTQFSDAQTVVDALVADMSASVDRVTTTLEAANGTIDLSGLQGIATQLTALAPVADPTPAPVVDEPVEPALDENGNPVTE